MNCPECPCETDVVTDCCSGDTICTSCGLVLDHHGWDTRSFTDAQPLESVLTSQTISNCPGRFKRAAGDSSKLRNLVSTNSSISSHAAAMALPQPVIKLSQELWEQISLNHVWRGDIRLGVIAACIYFACKLSSVPRTKVAVANIVGAASEAMKRGCKACHQHLQLSSCHARCLHSSTDSKDVIGMLAGSCCGLVGDDQTRRLLAAARQIDHAVTESGVLEGRTPQVRASAALAVAAERLQLCSLKAFCKKMKVSFYTLTRTVAVVKKIAK